MRNYAGFSTISGAVLTAYIALGVPPQNLVTSSVMSIPASIAISKMRIPETDEPVTRGRVIVDRGDGEDAPVNALHAFSKGGWFGLQVAGQILYDDIYCQLNSLVEVSMQDKCAYHRLPCRDHQWFVDLGWPWIWYPSTYLAAHSGLYRISHRIFPWCIILLRSFNFNYLRSLLKVFRAMKSFGSPSYWLLSSLRTSS